MKRPEFPKERICYVVSDFPISSEYELDRPYCAPSSLKFQGDLHKAGLPAKECFYTYLSYDKLDIFNNIDKEDNLTPIVEDGKIYKGIGKIKYLKLPINETIRASKEVLDCILETKENILKVKPKIIIVTGKWSLYFLTNITTLQKTKGHIKTRTEMGPLLTYRSSILSLHESFDYADCIIIPMLPMVTRYKMQDKLPLILWDIKKAGTIYKDLKNGSSLEKYKQPKTNYNYNQRFKQTKSYLKVIYNILNLNPRFVSVDIETRKGYIDCIGISVRKNTGICIAFSSLNDPHIWTEKEEEFLIRGITKILKHSNCQIVGQNFSYDAQYLWKNWLLDVKSYHDTMTMNHTLYNYLPKALDFLASIYCDSYSYWKDMQSHGK